MINKHIILLVALLMTPSLWAQKHTVSGTVTDNATGETLIGATVMDARTGKGAVTNAYGRYSLTLPVDTVDLRISYVGYQSQKHTFLFSQDTVVNVSLLHSITLHEVVVSVERPTDPKSSQMSAINIPVEHIKSVPVLFGETDVVKAVQLLPGVQSGSEGMAGMYVRGGGPDENLFLLDGVPLYNVNHLAGFFSAFNSDAVKNVTLYKGSFPAHFGGRISSVLDVTTNNGNANEYHGGVSVGFIAAKAFLEGPIINDKTTFSISARRTYADALLNYANIVKLLSSTVTRAGYYFYDVNAKVTHEFSDKSRLFASYYMGDDVIYAKVNIKDGFLTSLMGMEDVTFKEYLKMHYRWGNIVGSLRWNYVLSPKLFMNATASYSRYRNNISLGMEELYAYGSDRQELTMDMSYKSGIRDITAKADFDYAPNPNHSVKFGASYIHHIFTPEVMGYAYDNYTVDSASSYTENVDTTLGEGVVHANELSAYIEDDWSIADILKVNYGMAISGFSTQDTIYPSIQPRVSARIMITDDLSFKAGYSYMTQYMHLLSNSSISLPTDLWVPVTRRIAPMSAQQVAAGLFYNFRFIMDLSVEAYYKKMTNLMEYRDGASFWGTSTNWEDKVCLGDGWAYGVEFLAQRTVGKVTGWVGYTWSRTERQFKRPGQELSNGNPFPAKYDRRHDVSIVLMYKPSKKFDASITWVYSSGNTATLAMQEYEQVEGTMTQEDMYSQLSSYGYVGYYESRNNFRMPAYHRMDASVNFHKDLKRGSRTFNISVYNLYNRKNPYMVYESNRYSYTYNGQRYGSALVQLSIFPIIPSVSYIYKF
jgi:hypothetical protein